MAEETNVPAEQEEAAVEAAPVAPTAVAAAPAPRAVFTPDLAPELQPVGEETPRKEVANGRAYEIAYIVQANNPSALDSTQERVRALIDGVEGAVDNVRVSEIRRLAYPIAKQTEGVYVVINARFEKALTEELDRYFKIEETVLRHIILRED